MSVQYIPYDLPIDIFNRLCYGPTFIPRAGGGFEVGYNTMPQRHRIAASPAYVIAPWELYYIKIIAWN